MLSDDTEPQLRQRSYKHAEPAVADVLLPIEMAETSLRYDRVTKRPPHAEAGDVSRVSGAAESVRLPTFPDVALGPTEIFA